MITNAVERIDGTGVDRRAFGTLIGEQRLALYTVGWASNADHGRLSVGFATATFHVVMSCDGDDWRYRFSDDVFEELPGCGPSVPASQAGEHRNLPFVIRASDAIHQGDRRAWWLWHSLVGTRCFVTRPVLELRESVRLVRNGAPTWQFIGKTDTGDGRMARLCQLVDDDHTLLDVLDLAPGETATRQRRRGRWTRYRELPYAV